LKYIKKRSIEPCSALDAGPATVLEPEKSPTLAVIIQYPYDNALAWPFMSRVLLMDIAGMTDVVHTII